MANLLTSDELCYMNRIALYTQNDPQEADPGEIFSYFFDLEKPLAICHRLTERFCAASSQDSHPGPREVSKIIGFFQKLELLTEACYLVYRKGGRAAEAVSCRKPQVSLLTPRECEQPFQVLHQFFHYRSLGEWKMLAEGWCDAAVTGYSIADNIAAEEILPSFIYWWRLIETAWLLFPVESGNILEEPGPCYECTCGVAA